MTPAEAAKLIASAAAVRSQAQRMQDAINDLQAAQMKFMDAQARMLDCLAPLLRAARTVLDDHARESENVVKLRDSIKLPTERA